jgi:hypothetical protein
VREFSFNGIDGSWAPEDEKRALRTQFEQELDELDAQLDKSA